jgi:hypothetical protein
MGKSNRREVSVRLGKEHVWTIADSPLWIEFEISYYQLQAFKSLSFNPFGSNPNGSSSLALPL